ncbi:MAG: hypothetical protein HY912_19825 [Desulfomonile tiedjei]|uniref:DUF5132 domain-containing protein n=1 Tax=Desulfomonile tiedjei TaxID=2358 RepID=A0A9D6V6T4_9BACT|nr:hypothetical protein [Desulfomonile tiedjei]
MAILDFRPKGDLFTSLAFGVGVLAAPVLVPLAWSAARPLLKTILKGGFVLYEMGRGAFGDVSKSTESEQLTMAAAVKAPIEEEQSVALPREEVLVAPETENVDVLEKKVAAEKPSRKKPRRQPKKATKKTELDK